MEDALDKLLTKINDVIPSLRLLEKAKFSSKKLEQTNIKPLFEILGFKKDSKITPEIINILANKLTHARIHTLNEASPSFEISEEEDSISDKSDSSGDIPLTELLAVENNFTEINKIKKHHLKELERYYYKRPTPAYVLFEENDAFLQADYNGRHIYECNIDGLSDTHNQNRKKVNTYRVCLPIFKTKSLL